MKKHTDLKKLVEDRIAHLNKLMASILNHTFIPPIIKYRLKGSDAGRADLDSRILDFNTTILEDNTDEYIEHTVPHEYAHLGVKDIHGDVPFHHGKEWQTTMKHFGLPPRITHTYKIRAVKLHVWACPCAMHDVDDKLHRALLRGSNYICVKCGEPAKQIPPHKFAAPY